MLYKHQWGNRMKLAKCAAVLVATATLVACATAPANYSVNKSRSYDKGYDQVWEDLVSFFASNNIPIKNIAKDSGVIYAESTRFDDSYADCGKPGIMAVVGRKANFNVFVNRSGAKPAVSVNTDFTEFRRFDTAQTTVQCNSKGIIEARLLDSVRQ